MTIDPAAQELHDLRERVAKLEEALKPFALIAESVLTNARNVKPGHAHWITRSDRTAITYGDLRRVRALKLRGDHTHDH